MKENKINIKFFSKGGSCPYQAEGMLDKKYWFYFRERHGFSRLEIYGHKTEFEKLNNAIVDIGVKTSYHLTNIQAESLIIQMYNSLLPILKNYER